MTAEEFNSLPLGTFEYHLAAMNMYIERGFAYPAKLHARIVAHMALKLEAI